MDTLIQKTYLHVMKINNFRGGLTNISAKKNHCLPAGQANFAMLAVGTRAGLVLFWRVVSSCSADGTCKARQQVCSLVGCIRASRAYISKVAWLPHALSTDSSDGSKRVAALSVRSCVHLTCTSPVTANAPVVTGVSRQAGRVSCQTQIGRAHV